MAWKVTRREREGREGGESEKEVLMEREGKKTRVRERQLIKEHKWRHSTCRRRGRAAQE